MLRTMGVVDRPVVQHSVRRSNNVDRLSFVTTLTFGLLSATNSTIRVSCPVDLSDRARAAGFFGVAMHSG